MLRYTPDYAGSLARFSRSLSLAHTDTDTDTDTDTHVHIHRMTLDCRLITVFDIEGLPTEPPHASAFRSSDHGGTGDASVKHDY